MNFREWFHLFIFFPKRGYVTLLRDGALDIINIEHAMKTYNTKDLFLNDRILKKYRTMKRLKLNPLYCFTTRRGQCEHNKPELHMFMVRIYYENTPR